MSFSNPDNIDESGNRDIASYYYPLIGPYATSDDNVLGW